MKIFVIGGTGLVGSYLLPSLIENGYAVYALTRDYVKTIKINKLGATGILGDIRNLQGFKKELPEQLDIIVLLAMPSLNPGSRISKKRKNELRIETNDFFRNSLDLATRYDIPIILPSGTSFSSKNDEVVDETWPILRTGLTEIGKDTDEMVNKAIQKNNPKVIQLLYGRIYGNGGLFLFMYKMMAKGRSKIIGKGDNYIPNIHAKDAVSAIVKAIEKQPIGEKFIISDDTAVTQRDFINHMADLMNKRHPGHFPSFIFKMILGKDLFEIVHMDCKVSNEKAKNILDWQLKYPSYKEGLAAAIKEIEENKNYFA